MFSNLNLDFSSLKFKTTKLHVGFNSISLALSAKKFHFFRRAKAKVDDVSTTELLPFPHSPLSGFRT